MKLSWVAANFLNVSVALATSHQAIVREQPREDLYLTTSPVSLEETDGDDDGSGKGGQKRSGLTSLLPRGDDDKREITYVVYSKANKPPAEIVTETLKEQGNSMIFSVSPMTEENFKKVIQHSRQTILDKMMRYPEKISVVIVSPEESAEETLRSDESPWPFTSLKDRENEMLATFRYRIPRPEWSFLVDLSSSSRCKLPVRENGGISEALLSWSRFDLRSATASLRDWKLPPPPERDLSEFRQPTSVYRCTTLPVPPLTPFGPLSPSLGGASF